MNTMAILNPDDQIELARFGDVKSPLVVALTSFNGIRYLDVRRYYFDKLTGQLKPTPKGIALKEEEFSNLLELFLETGDKVKKMYGNDLSAIELAGRSNAKEARARKKASEKANDVKVAYESWPGPPYFAGTNDGFNFHLRLNRRSEFFSTIHEQGATIEGLIAHLLGSYFFAKEKINQQPNAKVLAAFELLELEWGAALK